MTRIGAVLALTLLIAACVCAPPTARAASGSADVLHRAQDILFRMLQAQENLTSFQATAAARVYIGGRNVLTTSVGLAFERPNRVAVRWLGMTIEPRHGLIFIDPEVFVSKDYVLSVLSAPSEEQRRRVGAIREMGNIGCVVRVGRTSVELDAICGSRHLAYPASPSCRGQQRRLSGRNRRHRSRLPSGRVQAMGTRPSLGARANGA